MVLCLRAVNYVQTLDKNSIRQRIALLSTIPMPSPALSYLLYEIESKKVITSAEEGLPLERKWDFFYRNSHAF